MATNDELKTLLLSVQEDVKFTKTKVSTMTEDIKILKKADEDILAELKDCKSKCSSLEKKNTLLEKQVSSLEEKLQAIEIKSKERNVILYNIDEPTTDQINIFDKIKKIFNDAQMDIPDDGIEKVFRLGKNIGARPVLVAFTNVRYKNIFFSKARNLQTFKIAFSNDFTFEQRELRKKLKDYQSKLSLQGISSVIRGSRLMVDGKLYDITTVQKMFKKDESQEAYYSDGGVSNASISSTASRKRGRPSKQLTDSRKLQRTQKEINIQTFFQRRART